MLGSDKHHNSPEGFIRISSLWLPILWLMCIHTQTEGS